MNQIFDVSSVTWKHMESDGFEAEKWIPEIELHLLKHLFKNIIQFYEWYAPKCNKSLDYFI